MSLLRTLSASLYHPAGNNISLIGAAFSLFRRKYSLLILPRDIAAKRLNSGGELRRGCVKNGQNRKNSLYFPAKQGISTETGSIETAHTAIGTMVGVTALRSSMAGQTHAIMTRAHLRAGGSNPILTASLRATGPRCFQKVSGKRHGAGTVSMSRDEHDV